jgi:polyisoprenoid-binding protein YceI
MIRHLPVILVTFALLATVAALLGWARPAASPAAAQEGRTAGAAPTAFTVDPLHSTVVFGVDHLGVSRFYGRFNRVTGSYALSPETGEGRFELSVGVENVDTANGGRDGHLKSPDFFNAKEFPTIDFSGSKLLKTADGTFSLSGELSLHGQTRPITARLEWIGERDVGERFGYRSGFEATFSVKRSDFGMGKYVAEGTLGDEVKIIAAIEGIRKESD